MAVEVVSPKTFKEVDPELSTVIAGEDQRQREKIILVPSESMAPPAVREVMSSNFGNVYAEGYPREESRQQAYEEILDIKYEIAHYRRYSDPRYYKGVEYADILEALTRRRAAKLFAANGVDPDDLYVNVQPLSGSPANSAVYSALMEPGDTLMGLHLNHGGHLTHGSRVSRSGKLYNAVPYRLNLETEQLDFDEIAQIARTSRPRVIVAGFSAYPLVVDWKRFREIADEVGAYLVADIAHISGLVAAGVHPSPIGIADVVTTTTHKSLCGPRGAMILTHNQALSRKIDSAVFPGEQGGPHLNTMAALALALKLANSDEFRSLQKRVVRNASRLADRLKEAGLRLVSGGSENHMLLIDVKSVTNNGAYLSGDMASRLLDTAGIVTNRNTIPGDKGPASATGVRIGTVWISQLGYGDDQIDELGDAISSVLLGAVPYAYSGRGGKEILRAKVNYSVLKTARATVAKLTGEPRTEPEGHSVEVRGKVAADLLNYALTSDVEILKEGESQPSHIFGLDLDADCLLFRASQDKYHLHFSSRESAVNAAQFIRELSDGYIQFDDLLAKLPGPVVATIFESEDILPQMTAETGRFVDEKPYFVGWQNRPSAGDPIELFAWNETETASLKKTKLFDTHVEMGGRMVPFGGWDMPVWYSSVSDEHAAVRQAAGLFDVSHMGVLEASGPFAAAFLDTVTTNDIHSLEVGRSHYTYLLFPDGSVVDDLLIYRRDEEQFLLVVNASNNDKDWAWLNAVNEGRACIDNNRPWARIVHPAVLKDLRDPQWGDSCLVDIALQGPASTGILLNLCDDPDLQQKIKSLPWAGLVEGTLGGFKCVISRTGYTGERVAYELFVHPDKSPEFWQALLQAGESQGIKPCGLAARDSTRTEAGLPLYGHELAGPFELSPAEAGFAGYVKTWKPFFIGRDATIIKGQHQDHQIVRFRMNEKAVRRPELGDPVLDKRGKVVGQVTSCAIDSEGYLLGQAIVPTGMTEPGNSLAIYQLGGGTRQLQLPKSIQLGARLPAPDRATVLSRFP